MRLLAVASLALCLSGCSSLAVGPSVTVSRDLGFQDSYVGTRVAASHSAGSFDLWGEANYLDSHKVGGGDGYGLAGLALLDWRSRAGWLVGAGVHGSRQTAAAWGHKDSWQPRFEAGRDFGPASLRAYCDCGDSSRDRIRTFGLRFETAGRLRLVIDAERVQTRFPKNGSKATVALLWGIL